MRQHEKSTILDEELQDLKLRFELLEGDRKAYYETSQWAIRQNKDEITRLRGLNKDISDAIAKLKKVEVETQNNRPIATELEKFDQKVCEIHKRYDELQAEVRSKEDRIQEMRDQLRDLQKEAETLRSNLQDSPQAKEIRTLENRLDKAMIKYNEAQSIRKTYEQIVKRLQEERLTYDTRLATFEKTLKLKKQDALELEMMSRDANHAKEVAKAELLRFEQQINEERKQRERDLQVRRELVKQKVDFTDKLDRKALHLEDSHADTGNANDINKEQYDEMVEHKMIEYEEIMRYIKEATGVSDINEVIAKFQSQGDTHNHLVQLQTQNESRIEDLKKKKADVLQEFEELKYTGESRHAHSRRMIEELQQHLSEARNRCQETKLKFDRVNKLLANSAAGIQHLADKLENIPLPDRSTDNGGIIDVLEACLQKLEILANNVQGKELPETAVPAAQGANPNADHAPILQVSPSILPQFNTRIKLRAYDSDEDMFEDDDENDDDYGEVPDRETIKKHTTQMLISRKGKQSKKVKKKRAD
ncbi:hypothetical protein HK102_009269 [Quaeritorhiza haematococci]|nr:hypothetical protein HK102_009269 [Quaeritorhiza haematococci]